MKDMAINSKVVTFEEQNRDILSGDFFFNMYTTNL